MPLRQSFIARKNSHNSHFINAYFGKNTSNLFIMSDFFGLENMSDFFEDREKRWRVITDMAVTFVKNGGKDENVEPLKRANLEDLSRIAQLNISEVLDLDVSGSQLVPATQAQYVKNTVKAYRPYFECLEAFTPEGMEVEISGDLPPEMLGQLLGGGSKLTPLLTTFIIGMGVGNLGLEAMSSYELLVPHQKNDIMLVTSNIDDFQNEWVLNEDDFWMWLCLTQLSLHAVISIPHIRDEMASLVKDFARSFEPSTGESMERLAEGYGEGHGEGYGEGHIEGYETGEESISQVNFLEGKLMGLISNEPEMLLGAQVSEIQEPISEQLSSLVAVVQGVSQFATNAAAKKMFGASSEIQSIKEAMFRKQAVTSQAVNMISRLLGIDMSSELKELGADFVSNIFEVAGIEGINQLLESPETLPSPNELGTPSLWLARMGGNN